MTMQVNLQPISMLPLVLLRVEPAGQVTAQLVGLPEVQATAATREEALDRVRELLDDWLTSGRLALLEARGENPWRSFAGWAKNDPEYGEFLEELNRYRQDLDAEPQE
jgi:predicted RNase H-like HicB family nuclease